jgi:hypothetical protein
VPGVNGRYGLSTFETKFAGSIDAEYGVPTATGFVASALVDEL